MLVIRLARTGKKKQAYFRVVVADKRRAVTSKFIEILGNYDPHAKKLSLKQDRLEEYLKNGAQPSNSLAKLLAKEGLKLPKWVQVTEKKRAPKKAEEPKAEKPAAKEAEPAEAAEGGEQTEPAAEVPAESTAEVTPAEEAPVEEAEKEAAPEEKSESTSAEATADEENKEGEVEPQEEEK